MNIIKTAFYSLAVVSILGVTSAASANTAAIRGPSVAPSGQGGHIAGRHSGHVGEKFTGSSSTASFFYSKGVRNFDRGNLEKAEEAFRATLRAQGSTGLDALTYRYLIYINQQQGDQFASDEYKQAYLKLAEK